MHPTTYTKNAADLIAIRDRVPVTSRLRGLVDSAARVAIANASAAAASLTEHHDTPGWCVNDFECLTWHERDGRLYPSRYGVGVLGEVDAATHIEIVWCDSADAHDDRRTFHLRADSAESFDVDFAAMISSLTSSP